MFHFASADGPNTQQLQKRKTCIDYLAPQTIEFWAPCVLIYFHSFQCKEHTRLTSPAQIMMSSLFILPYNSFLSLLFISDPTGWYEVSSVVLKKKSSFCWRNPPKSNRAKVSSVGEFLLHECFVQWLAVSYRYRIGKVYDTIFEYRGKYREKFQSIGIVSGKNQNFNSVTILIDQCYVLCMSVTFRLNNSEHEKSIKHWLETMYKLFSATF